MTRVATVIGWPIGHSRSPVIHRHWLAEHGIDGDYRAMAVEPDRVADHLRSIHEGRYVGTNVTIPHKEAALAAVDIVADAAGATGAVNTVWSENGRLVGDNTDPEGFTANLDEAAPEWAARPGRAVVLGAGGAARAVAWSLIGRGFGDVVLVNRTVERAERVAAQLAGQARAASLDNLAPLLAEADLLVNATSLGMTGQPALEVPLASLPAHAVVADIVYTPLETALLAAARGRGLTAVDGLGMLLHQAVPGFERWFGVRPRVTAKLRDLVVAAMAADGAA